MDTPDFFVGARLGAARIKAGISLEQAAKDTRIRVQRLREIEADDFSGFAHPTYSRLFLLDYAEYLGIPVDEIRPLLPDRAGSAGGGFQYIDALTREPSSPVIPLRSKGTRLLRILLASGILVLLATAGLFAYFTLRKIERVAGSSTISLKTDAPTEPPVVTKQPAPPAVEPPPTPESSARPSSPSLLETGEEPVPLSLEAPFPGPAPSPAP